MNGSVKSTGMMIIRMFCTVVTSLPVVLNSETRKNKKKKRKTARERNVPERELRERDLLKLYFLQKSYQLPLQMQL